MCGRFVQAGPVDRYASFFAAEAPTEPFPPRFNLAPTQDILTCRVVDGRRRIAPLRWGLVPHWSQGPNRRYSMINARAETVHIRPAYRGPFRHRRCLIPAFEEVETLRALLRPFNDAEMETYPVSPKVNSPKNEGSDLLDPIDD